ncbi:MAG: response regulator transcription factor [Firmicutes bacterium]|nr:response regulator transcription factor [Bacillota bacterium]
MGRIRLLLVDDHTVLRSGLKAILQSQADFEVVGDVATGEEVLALARGLRPDVVLMDITLPGLNGLEATRALKKAIPDIRVLVLTQHEDQGYLRQALEAGASGYVPKRAADTELFTAVRLVYRGGVFLYPCGDQPSADTVWAGRPTDPSDRSEVRLSEREREVLRLLALGHTAREIGDKLAVSPKTVETYKMRVMEKLNLQEG